MQKILSKIKGNEYTAIMIMVVVASVFTIIMADFLFTMFVRIFAPMDGI